MRDYQADFYMYEHGISGEKTLIKRTNHKWLSVQSYFLFSSSFFYTWYSSQAICWSKLLCAKEGCSSWHIVELGEYLGQNFSESSYTFFLFIFYFLRSAVRNVVALSSYRCCLAWNVPVVLLFMTVYDLFVFFTMTSFHVQAEFLYVL